MDYPCISIVVIGRNEASNLPDCFRSIQEMDYPQEKLDVIYVDTGSTDGSVQIARQWGVRIAEEVSDFPSPALARNRGIREAVHDIIHFIDGDMTIAPNYLKRAVQHLGKDGIVCVIGKLDERQKDKNLISWILHYNWAMKKVGFVDAPGAGGAFLKSALLEVGGYNAEIFRGEEPDIGFRLREKGFRILLIDEMMGTHDYDINTPGKLIRFFLSMGQSFGKVLLLPSSPSLINDRAVARNTLIQTILLIVVAVALCITGKWLFLLFLPPAVASYVVMRHWNNSPERRLQAISYYLLMYAGKPVMTIGMLCFWWRHIRILLQRKKSSQ